MRFFIPVCLAFALLAPAFGQSSVDSRNLYERLLVITPVAGQGTWADPLRPLFVPLPSQMTPGDRSGMIAFHQEMSDDGKVALVELVFSSRAALAAALVSLTAQPSVKAFQKGKDARSDIEKAFRAFKKDFDLDKFFARVP